MVSRAEVAVDLVADSHPGVEFPPAPIAAQAASPWPPAARGGPARAPWTEAVAICPRERLGGRRDGQGEASTGARPGTPGTTVRGRPAVAMTAGHALGLTRELQEHDLGCGFRRSRPPLRRPPTSGRLRVGKGGRLHPGRVAAFTSESLAGFARNTHLGGRAAASVLEIACRVPFAQRFCLASAACVLRTR